jgi:eukaryotic-like serine/threonine-protein kinase
MGADPASLGRYVLFDEIASGGMASVHLGRLVGPGGFLRTVAIKRLHPHLAKDPEFVAMFLDEARLAARIRHPNVVPTLDVVAQRGEVLLVMEYVHGESLSRLWRLMRERESCLPLPIVCAVMGNVLSGLHAAHEAMSDQGLPLGIVHRDVSPQNVLVGVDGVARVLDFGVAKAALRYQSTQEGRLKGKLAYMAPEQIELREVDRRSDVFAASTVFWEALTGARLFDTSQPAATIAKIMNPETPAPSSLVSTVPRVLDEIVLRGLERDPARRFASALEMAKALEVSVRGASAREVSEWLEAIAPEAITQRAKRVAEVESGSSGDGAPLISELLGSRGSLALESAEAVTEISVSLAVEALPSAELTTQGGPAHPRRSGKSIAGVALALATLLFVAWFGLRRHPQDQAAAASPSLEAPSASSATDLPPVDPAPTSSPSSAFAAPAASASISPSSHAPRPQHATRPRSRNCEPNYSVDERGIKHFKPECLAH